MKEFTEEEIHDYLIAAEAAKWGKEVSKDCEADSSELNFARNQLKGMLANALATRTDDELDLESYPTYLSWVSWGMEWRNPRLDGLVGYPFWEEYGQWDNEGRQERTYLVAIGKHLSKPEEKWDMLVHEAMHWGPGRWPETLHHLIEHIVEKCVERDSKEEKRLKEEDPPHAPGWSDGDPYDGGNPPIGSSGCSIWISRRCGGGPTVGEEGDCGDEVDWGEGGPPEGAVCTLDEIVANGCTYRVTGICWGGASLSMLLDDTGLRLAHIGAVGADMGGGLACSGTPAAGPPAPGERPAWIAEAAIASPDTRRRPKGRRPEGVGKRRNDGFRAIPAGSGLHRATERP